MSVAQWERETISERVADAMRYVKAIGARAGTIPFGRRLANPGDRDDTRMEDDPAEAEALVKMVAWREAGSSFRAIARRLEAEGVPTKSGRTTWRPSSVQSILKRHADGRRA